MVVTLASISEGFDSSKSFDSEGGGLSNVVE